MACTRPPGPWVLGLAPSTPAPFRVIAPSPIAFFPRRCHSAVVGASSPFGFLFLAAKLDPRPTQVGDPALPTDVPSGRISVFPGTKALVVSFGRDTMSPRQLVLTCYHYSPLRFTPPYCYLERPPCFADSPYVRLTDFTIRCATDHPSSQPSFVFLVVQRISFATSLHAYANIPPSAQGDFLPFFSGAWSSPFSFRSSYVCRFLYCWSFHGEDGALFHF